MRGRRGRRQEQQGLGNLGDDGQRGGVRAMSHQLLRQIHASLTCMHTRESCV